MGRRIPSGSPRTLQGTTFRKLGRRYHVVRPPKENRDTRNECIQCAHKSNREKCLVSKELKHLSRARARARGRKFYLESILVVAIPRWMLPQADKCLRCFVLVCGSVTIFCTHSGAVCGVPSKLSDRLRSIRKVGSTSKDNDALVGACIYRICCLRIYQTYPNFINHNINFFA